MSIDKQGKLKKLLETFKTLTGDAGGGQVQTTVPGDDDKPIVVNEPQRDMPIVTTAVSMRQPTDFDRYEQLPIGQPDYVPSTSDELARACRLLLRDVPNEHVSMMWKKITQLVNKTADNASIMRTGFEETQEKSKMKTDATMKTEAIRHVIRRLIREAGYGRRYSDTDDLGPSSADLDAIEAGLDEPISSMRELPGSREKFATMGIRPEDHDMLRAISRNIRDEDSDEDPADISADELETMRRKYVTAGEEGMKLKDIAQKMGYSGPAGVKNLLYIIEDKIQYFASLDEVWFRDMMHEFARAYIEELLDAGGANLTQREVQFLSDLLIDVDELDEITEMDTFRVWAQECLNKIYKGKLGKPARYSEAKAKTMRKIKEALSPDDKSPYDISSGDLATLTRLLDEPKIGLDPQKIGSDYKLDPTTKEFAKAYIEELLDAGGVNLTQREVQFLNNALNDDHILSQIAQTREFKDWKELDEPAR